jgi:hypothetical protein
VPIDCARHDYLTGGDGDACRLTLVASTELQAADSPEPVAGRRFELVAYTGGPIKPGRWWSPVIVDLGGGQPLSSTLPLLLDHTPTPDYVLGRCDSVTVETTRITAAGELAAVGAAATEALRLADLGHPFQTSVGMNVLSTEYVEPGVTVEVNGRTVTGPIDVVRKWQLREISVTVLGADAATSFTPADSPEDSSGSSPEPTTEPATPAPVAATARPTELRTLAAAARPPVAPPRSSTVPDMCSPEMIASIQAAQLEVLRWSAVIDKFTGSLPELKAQILAEGMQKWSEDRIELEALRLGRKVVTAQVGNRTEGATREVLEAAMCLTGGLNEDSLVKQYGEQHVELARKKFSGLGIKKLLEIAAQANGYDCGIAGVTSGNLQAALSAALQASSGPTTFSLPGILSSVANKFLLEGYMGQPETWSTISAVRPVRDYKQTNAYRLVEGFKFKRVTAEGDMPQGRVSEEVYTNKAEPYGLTYTLTEVDWMNDDLQAFSELPAAFGRGSAEALSEVFWTEWLADLNTFYTTDRRNLAASSPLGPTGLTTAKTLMRKQIDPNGKVLNLMPIFLVVPPELEDVATVLLRDRELRDNTANARYVPGNPHAGAALTPVVVPHLSDTTITGNSATSYYLTVAPTSGAAPIEVAFLNGQRLPVIETAPVGLEKFGGLMIRGKHSFGVKKQNYRGSVRATA